VARLIDLLEREASSGFEPEEVLRDDATLMLLCWTGVPTAAAPVPSPRESGVLI